MPKKRMGFTMTILWLKPQVISKNVLKNIEKPMGFSHSFPKISPLFKKTISKALSFCGRMALALCNAVSPVKKTYQQHAVPPNSRHGYISQKTLVSTASHGLNPWRLVKTRLPCCCCNVKSAQAASLKRETRKNGTENIVKTYIHSITNHEAAPNSSKSTVL